MAEKLTKEEKELLEKHRAKKIKKKGQYSKYLIAFIVAINVIFTATVLFLYLRVKSEPSTLIGAWFGFTTMELWNLAMIKKKKMEKKENDYES